MTIAPYLDVDTTHDHTYYGNGCQNGWGTSGNGGSITPCSTRIVKDGNNEDQKTGTLYHYMAASSGSGTTASVRNDIIPDTFCPLGWQMPYSGSGGDYYDQSKSWKYLFTRYGLENSQAGQESIRSYPFSYVYSGRFHWYTGRLYYFSTNGLFWPSTIKNDIYAYRFDYWNTSIRPNSEDAKAGGSSIRCDCRISNLEQLSMASAFTHQYYGFSFFKSAFPLCQNYE